MSKGIILVLVILALWFFVIRPRTKQQQAAM